VETAPTSLSVSSARASKEYILEEDEQEYSPQIYQDFIHDHHLQEKKSSSPQTYQDFVREREHEHDHDHEHIEEEAPSILPPTTTHTTPQISSMRASKDYDENLQVVTPEDWLSRFQSDSSLSTTTASDTCPDRAILAAVHNIPIFSASGTSIPFGSIYEPAIATHTRQLVIFVRHFYCGACQAYLQALTSSISPSEYFSIPTPTSIVVIGCGKPDMIEHYKRFTGCPFPIYADPSRSLFKRLGMNLTLNFGGQRPEYMADIPFMKWQNGQIAQIASEVRNPDNGVRKRDAFRGGNLLQIGGEFLFEEGEVVWCHRMRSMRDHAEVGVIRRLLELDD
jgi:hypothetical protein